MKTARDYPVQFSPSKNPLLSRSESGGVLLQFGEKLANASRKKEFLQLQFASFFRFMATNLSLTHLVTAAKPR